MSACAEGQVVNRGYCAKCSRVVPVERVRRDNCLYLVKECPNCGHGETLISRDAELYYKKRALCGYEKDAEATCSLNCLNCKHGVAPKLVVIDVTNHCNMNCPICLANLPAMGFDFHPPTEYFDRIFRYLTNIQPRPRIQFFGGEPTCRDDLLELLRMAQAYHLEARIVTNGIRLADEEYCKKVLATNPRIMLGLDGLNPVIQEKLRRNPGSLAKKLKALENIEKHTKSQIILMCTTGVGVSEEQIPGLFQLCYAKRDLIYIVTLIPLQATVGPQSVGIETSTHEDVENLMAKCFPGMEFVPAGALRLLKNFQDTYNVRINLGGAHPNCETFALMIADDESYHPVNDYLKVPLTELVRILIEWDKQIGPRLERGILGRLFGKKGRKIQMTWSLLRMAFRYIRMDRAIGPRPVRTFFRALWTKIATGEPFKRAFRRYSAIRAILQVYVLPYEECGMLESARLVDCPVAFACEHPVTGEVITVPFCSYFVYKNDILRVSAERWARKAASAEASRAESAAGEQMPREFDTAEYLATTQTR